MMTMDMDPPDPPAVVESAPARPSMKWPMLAAGLGDAGDILSTQYAMSKGAHESNPLLPSGRVGNAVAQGLEGVLTQFLMHELGPKHPTLAKILGATVGGIGAYSTMRNIQSARAQDRYTRTGGRE